MGENTIHSIYRSEADARGMTNPTKYRFEGFYRGTAAEPYVIDLDVERMAGSDPGPNSGGFFVFRETDPDWFYQLNFNAGSTTITYKKNGVYSPPVANSAYGFTTDNNEFRVRLVLADNRFTVYDRDVDLLHPILVWEDPQHSYPVGFNTSYYARPGSLWCWTKVHARSCCDQSLCAWDMPGVGVVEGYAPGVRNVPGTAVQIANAKFDLTFDNYRSDIPAYGSWSTVEVGQMGNLELAFHTTAGGGGISYRCSSPMAAGHLPRQGYQVRQLPDGRVQWGLVDSSSVFKPKATSIGSYDFGTNFRVYVVGGTHMVTLDNGYVVIPTQVDATYDGTGSHVRCMFGFDPGVTGGVIGGWVKQL